MELDHVIRKYEIRTGPSYIFHTPCQRTSHIQNMIIPLEKLGHAFFFEIMDLYEKANFHIERLL